VPLKKSADFSVLSADFCVKFFSLKCADEETTSAKTLALLQIL